MNPTDTKKNDEKNCEGEYKWWNIRYIVLGLMG